MKEGENKNDGFGPPKKHESKRVWEPMTVIQVGTLDVIQNVVGSFTDSGGGMMMGFGT